VTRRNDNIGGNIQTSSGGATFATAPESAAIVPFRSSERSDDSSAGDARLALEVPATLVDALAARAAEIIAEQNAGFLDVKGAAEFLGGWSQKRIYNLVERRAIPFYKPQGRLLFDPHELREWVMEAGHGRR
jgi:hypothetical protein